MTVDSADVSGPSELDRAIASSPFVKPFRSWSRPTDFEVAEAVGTGLVAIDTNVLLSLYKVEASTADAWIKVLESLGKRLWIPHEVMVEFWRNRATLAVHAESAAKATSAVDKGLAAIRKGHREWLHARGLDVDDAASQPLEQIEEAVASLRKEYVAARSEHETRYDSDPTKDTIVKDLAPLFADKASVGTPYSTEDLAAHRAEAEKRFTAKVPPGYMDDPSHNSQGKDGDTKYGDYFLWAQLLDRAREWSEQETRDKVVVLVTDDMKEDWWRKHVTRQGGGLQVPRPELVAEMEKVSGCEYFQITPAKLFEHVTRTIGIDVTPGMQAQVQRVSEAGADESEWFDEDFLLERGGTVVAQAKVHKAMKGPCIVLAGSQAMREQVPSVSSSYIRMLQDLVEAGALVESETESGRSYVFARDYEFRSVSAAASIVLGRNSSGMAEWKTTEGLTAGQARAAHSSDDDDDV